MSTIIRLSGHDPATRGNFTDYDYLKVVRSVYSVDGYSPVLVTIKVGETTAWLTTTVLPDGRNSWWREPTAAQRRMLLDHELFKLGMVRSGRVFDITADAWHHQYPVRRVAVECEGCRIQACEVEGNTATECTC